MNFDDQILQLLGTSPDVKFSARQIGNLLNQQWSGEDPDWAALSLELLVMQGRVRFDCGSYWFQSRASCPMALAA